MIWNKTSLKQALLDDIVYMDQNSEYIIENVVYDNRRISGKTLFIAKKGEKTDGHNYIEETLNKYPEAIILANYNFDKENKFKNHPRIILVKDTIEAMEKLAKYKRKTTKAKVIGITGSLGKTTTKELFYSCLSNFGKTHCNIMSFNNYTGLSMTLCNLPDDVQYVILEMGMSAKGEMEKLSEIAKPDITIILNIVAAHSQFFHDEKEIALAKSEIFINQNKNYWTILNSSNEYYPILKQEAIKNGIKKILTFSEQQNNDSNIFLKKYNIIDDNANIVYNIKGKDFTFNTSNLDYNVAINLMPILLTIDELNLNIEKIYNTVENFGTPRGRNNIENANFNGKNITIINGTYNAVNPLAFIRGFELMNKISKNKKFNKKIAILGDIREAGENTEPFMLSLEKYILESKIDILFCIGEHIKILFDSIKSKINAKYYTNVLDSIQDVTDIIENNDLIFIKSSKGIKTYKILNELVDTPMDLFE